MTISYDDFAKVDVRIGTVLSAAPNPSARKPAYVLEIDFGVEIGRKKASAAAGPWVRSPAPSRAPPACGQLGRSLMNA